MMRSSSDFRVWGAVRRLTLAQVFNLEALFAIGIGVAASLLAQHHSTLDQRVSIVGDTFGSFLP